MMKVPSLVSAVRQAHMPLSTEQLRMQLVDQFEGASSLYNVPMVFRLTGDVDVDALDLAVRDLALRHETPDGVRRVRGRAGAASASGGGRRGLTMEHIAPEQCSERTA